MLLLGAAIEKNIRLIRLNIVSCTFLHIVIVKIDETMGYSGLAIGIEKYFFLLTNNYCAFLIKVHNPSQNI